MGFQRAEDLQFGFDFVREIAEVANDSKGVAQKLVDAIAHHHGWSHVSLFRVNQEGARFDLICQAASSRHHLPAEYSQAVTVGLMGLAHQLRCPVNAGDVRAPEWAQHYQELVPGTLSELVLPVPGTDQRWLLNIESDERDAFADVEQQSVEVQLRIAGFILERTASLEMKSAILKSVADGVVQTNDLDVILDVNPAAEQLLGRKVEELREHSLAHFVATDAEQLPVPDAGTSADRGRRTNTAVATSDAETALSGALDWPAPVQVNLKRADGELIPVLMSAGSLPARLGGKVFVISDLRRQSEKQRMDALTHVFHQIASEIRVPIALTEAFLTESLALTQGTAHDLVDKSLRQIRKADMPLERMVRLAFQADDKPLPRIVFNLCGTIASVVAELPQTDAEVIQIQTPEQDVPVRAAKHELLFCMRSLLAYLVRRRAQIEKVEIRLSLREKAVLMSLALPPLAREPQGDTPVTLPDSELELMLTEPVIKDLMRRMGGSYALPDASRRRFELSLQSEGEG